MFSIGPITLREKCTSIFRVGCFQILFRVQKYITSVQMNAHYFGSPCWKDKSSVYQKMSILWCIVLATARCLLSTTTGVGSQFLTLLLYIQQGLLYEVRGNLDLCLRAVQLLLKSHVNTSNTIILNLSSLMCQFYFTNTVNYFFC